MGVVFLEVVLVEEMRRALREGRAGLHAAGAVRPAEGLVPFVVVDAATAIEERRDLSSMSGILADTAYRLLPA